VSEDVEEGIYTALYTLYTTNNDIGPRSPLFSFRVNNTTPL
jgi:hypothetical protein